MSGGWIKRTKCKKSVTLQHIFPDYFSVYHTASSKTTSAYHPAFASKPTPASQPASTFHQLPPSTNFPTTSTTMVGSVLRAAASLLNAESAFCPISPTCPVGDTCQYEYGAVSLIVDCATEFAGGDLQTSTVRTFPLHKDFFALTTIDPYPCRLYGSLRFEQGLCSNQLHWRDLPS